MKQNLETKVGLFLMGGIAIFCALVIFFGSVSDLFKPAYSLTVRFPNASGLLKGSDVYLSGALIGKVTSDPHPIPDTQKVEITLKIDSSNKIREDAKYVVGSSGLLGDKFVDVQPVEYPEGTDESKKAAYVKDGATIDGSRNASIEDLTNSAQPLIEKANHIADQMDQIVTRLNNDFLGANSTQDVKESLNNLKDMLKNADQLLSQARSSKGAVGRLINDKQVGDNLADFIANLKEHGPLFYSDSAKEAKDKDGKKK